MQKYGKFENALCCDKCKTVDPTSVGEGSTALKRQIFNRSAICQKCGEIYLVECSARAVYEQIKVVWYNPMTWTGWKFVGYELDKIDPMSLQLKYVWK